MQKKFIWLLVEGIGNPSLAVRVACVMRGPRWHTTIPPWGDTHASCSLWCQVYAIWVDHFIFFQILNLNWNFSVFLFDLSILFFKYLNLWDKYILMSCFFVEKTVLARNRTTVYPIRSRPNSIYTITQFVSLLYYFIRYLVGIG